MAPSTYQSQPLSRSFMSWIYLVMAAMLEVGWTFSLKYLSWSRVGGITWLNFFNDRNNFLSILPLTGYIFFGIGNIIFLSLAMKNISASTVFAIWMAITLIGIKLVDVIILKESY